MSSIFSCQIIYSGGGPVGKKFHFLVPTNLQLLNRIKIAKSNNNSISLKTIRHYFTSYLIPHVVVFSFLFTYFRAHTCFPKMVYLALPPFTTISTVAADRETIRAYKACWLGRTSCIYIASIKSPNFLPKIK